MRTFNSSRQIDNLFGGEEHSGDFLVAPSRGEQERTSAWEGGWTNILPVKAILLENVWAGRSRLIRIWKI